MKQDVINFSLLGSILRFTSKTGRLNFMKHGPGMNFCVVPNCCKTKNVNKKKSPKAFLLSVKKSGREIGAEKIK